MIRKLLFAALSSAGLAAPQLATAQHLTTPNTGMYGTPSNLIDMPTAETAPDGQLSTTISYFGNTFKNTLSFQITPRLTGAFRYTAIKGLNIPGYTPSTYYDRSFDISYQILTESAYLPAVSVGLRDFIGTGLYSSEYIVATKGFANDRLRLTAGLGWGRLGSYQSIGSTDTRPSDLLGAGGIPTYDRWFRGDVAPFAGLSYALSDTLTFKAEYSSDAYTLETGDGILERKNPYNFGLDYRRSDNFGIGVYSIGGAEYGVVLRFALNPRTDGVPGGSETAPVPVYLRPRGTAQDLGWTTSPAERQSAQEELVAGLAREGLELEGIRLDGRKAHVLIRNAKYDIEAQAVGRTARVLTRTMPDSVETFVITQVVRGIRSTSVVVQRSDLERLENAPARDILAAAQFSTSLAETPDIPVIEGSYPRYSWNFAPYVQTSFFDPDNPLRADLGLRLKGEYSWAPGWVLSGSLTNRIAGTLSDTPRPARITPIDPPPVVRSDGNFYNRSKQPRIETLTVAKYGRLGPNLYGRLSAGLFESAYGGISGEVLWKPTGSRFALGAEANYVVKRDYDQLFDFQDYKVATGHLSAYYDFGNGFHGQLDVGRYLAGDLGATVSLDREFANGWRVGAYATKTDVSAASFGEGSFDKGIRITIPISWAFGQPDRRTGNLVLQSLARDGGARLNVDGRLYETIRGTHKSDMVKSWGKFWR